MRCDDCGFDYPDDEPMLVNRMTVHVNGVTSHPNVCGICALAIMNRATGDNRTRFNGTNAERFRQRALELRDGRRR